MKIASVTITKNNTLHSKSVSILDKSPFIAGTQYDVLINLLTNNGFEKLCNHTFEMNGYRIECRVEDKASFNIRDIHLLEQNESLLSNSILHFDNTSVMKNRIIRSISKL